MCIQIHAGPKPKFPRHHSLPCPKRQLTVQKSSCLAHPSDRKTHKLIQSKTPHFGTLEKGCVTHFLGKKTKKGLTITLSGGFGGSKKFQTRPFGPQKLFCCFFFLSLTPQGWHQGCPASGPLMSQEHPAQKPLLANTNDFM